MRNPVRQLVDYIGWGRWLIIAIVMVITAPFIPLTYYYIFVIAIIYYFYYIRLTQ